MKDESFYDTNIIYYAYDENEPAKKVICEKLIEDIFLGNSFGVISNQVLGELFKALIEKLKIDVEKAEKILNGIIDSENWIKINYNIETIRKAIITVRLYKVSFWDCLIAETMKENGIVKIYTENEKDFKKILGIKAINPLKKR